MSLFLDKKVSFEKRAGLENRLNPDPEKWPQEIASVLHRSLPYLTNYSVNVQIERADNERGYGYGTIKVGNKYDMPSEDNRSLTIPIIVKDRMLKPFDIMVIDGTTTPITEEAVREYLFQVSPVEITDRKPVDRDLTGQYLPPTGIQAGYGNMRGRLVTQGGLSEMMKMGSLRTPLPFARYLKEKIANSIELQTSLMTNPRFANSVERILENEENQQDNFEIKPNVVQIQKIANHKFTIKLANTQYWNPVQYELTTKEVVPYIGKIAYEMNPGDYTTLSDREVEQSDYSFERAENGTYSCLSQDGTLIDGIVTKISMQLGPDKYLFVSPYGYSINDEIYGKKIDSMKLAMNGQTNFVLFSGSDFTLEPMYIKYQSGQDYICKTASFGAELKITIEPLVRTITKLGGHWIIPESRIIPIVNKEIELDSTPIKTAASKNINQVLTVTKIGNEYLFEGQPIKGHETIMNKKEAEFLLAGFGIKEKLANLKNNETKWYFNTLPIKLAKNIDKEISKEAQILVQSFDLARDLIKEASILPDQDSVDTVLSLGMITPDNINQFISSIPDLEDCMDKISELLLYSRLGLSELPEAALENCIRNLLDVVKGLKMIRESQLL